MTLNDEELVKQERVSDSSLYQSEAARTALGQRYRLGRPETAFFIQPSGKILQGLDAFSPLLPHLPGGTLMQSG